MTFAAPVETKSIRFRARSFVAFTLTPEAPIGAWLEGLDHWIGNSPGYFAGRPVVLDLNVLKPEVADIALLVASLGARGIRVYAIELEGASLGLDLPPLLSGAKEATSDGLLSGRKGKAETVEETGRLETVFSDRGKDAGKPDEGKTAEIKAETGKGRAAKAGQDAGATDAVQAGTLMVKSPIRSGQSIFHPHGDVIVLGSVASGSEIIAAGSIHVYGTLRGRAIAGSQGNRSARIFCRRNEAELISVDGWYTTAEEMEGVSRGKAVQAFLEGDMLAVVPLN
ncbi:MULTISPECIES: septum site-determining protein MinC [unclassified Mesorhizobium]|uniref:septum site-determining protein MinC n=1 Tax=unclassified Mesorhizobium TaxID=325217 RepID=UPI000FD86180|nr:MULTISPECIES: septum site-determining protein MinC [unclassified Mesorhizobium]TGR47218.1 septum formation inhibitor MinC [bacterium M00.F.Ca.ET.199.01.1.1]TGU36668.1 septum formation inhibitor MinC [bacterium M00.F.Ca.ET.156.01.1.1]TGV87856.1 septum formation inhibitor MinC [Mesorhizobium sp. M00.F.Ca.ET.149.01.1.1]TGR28930.1 septum formation inhibitor MinC [Mesorhizobium sp. M8A.F.Ca.ET.202.01.1.1]TGR29844.1 septum formation inhibitor MinC [Mesorhizobium sp. M8A.F.Ca.ET.197.01.1.1]